MAGVVLASSSPRRVELLGVLGLKFEAVASNADETCRCDEQPACLVESLAEKKAAAIASERPEDTVIGADTIVVVGSRVLGKPEDAADAGRMLRLLSGRCHKVYTGVCVMRMSDGFRRTAHEVTKVSFAPMSEDDIERYVATGEPLGKAGAYAIQGYGSVFVTGIGGDYFNVVGLPLRLTARLLGEAGIRVL